MARAWLAWGAALVGVLALTLDPNVPWDAADYWKILLLEKREKLTRLKRYLLGGKMIPNDSFPMERAPIDPAVNNYLTKLDGVDVRIYDPINRGQNGERGPLFLYFHGGGFVLGTPDHYDLTTYHLSKQLPNFLIVSVDYRRAPVHLFPSALEDVETVYRFMVEHADSYLVDPARIVVGGDSAGGNLAAGLCIKLKEDNKNALPEDVIPMPKLQALIYPALQGINFLTTSFTSVAPLLSRLKAAAYWSLYTTGSEDSAAGISNNEHITPEKALEFTNPSQLSFSSPTSWSTDKALLSKLESLALNPLVSPLVTADPVGLPPAFIIACQYDVLRDDALFYTKRLKSAKVPVTLHVVEGAWHGIMFRSNKVRFYKGEEMTRTMTHFINDTI